MGISIEVRATPDKLHEFTHSQITAVQEKFFAIENRIYSNESHFY